MRKCEKEEYGKNSHFWYRMELKNLCRIFKDVCRETRECPYQFPKKDEKIVENEYKRVNMIVIDLT